MSTSSLATKPIPRTAYKIAFAMLVALTAFTFIVLAIPPVNPTLASLTQRSDLILIATITNVTERYSAKIAWERGQIEEADATVNQPLKGTAPQVIHLKLTTYPTKIVCRPPSLDTGQFILFLRLEGTNYNRTHEWYSQFKIETNQISLPQLGARSLDEAIREINSLVTAK